MEENLVFHHWYTTEKQLCVSEELLMDHKSHLRTTEKKLVDLLRTTCVPQRNE